MTTENTTATVELFNLANFAANGFMLRGKPLVGDWQVHRAGCRDGAELKRMLGRYDRHLVTHTGTLAEVRAAFNAEMGPGGTAGFSEDEGGWDFDQHVTVPPCARRK